MVRSRHPPRTSFHSLPGARHVRPRHHGSAIGADAAPPSPGGRPDLLERRRPACGARSAGGAAPGGGEFRRSDDVRRCGRRGPRQDQRAVRLDAAARGVDRADAPAGRCRRPAPAGRADGCGHGRRSRSSSGSGVAGRADQHRSAGAGADRRAVAARASLRGGGSVLEGGLGAVGHRRSPHRPPAQAEDDRAAGAGGTGGTA